MKTKIGGQAVLEGVMMRGEKSLALAVRDEGGNIRMDTRRLKEKKPWYCKVPFLRGSINLVLSMIDGMKTITRSAEVFAEDDMVGEDTSMGLVTFISVILGLVLACGLFILLPTMLTGWIINWLNINAVWVRSLIEGVIKLIIIIVYMSGISHMKEIKRLYRYHGAEHKTIACFEAELPLTVENVQKCSRYHDRCGTSFIVFVMIMSVALMLIVESVCYAVGFDAISITWVRSLIKIGMLPLTAGVSYEMLMLLARSNFVLFRPLKWMGKQFQRITTQEPDDSMCEVAIRAFEEVLVMDGDPTVAEQHFPEAMTLEQYRELVKPLSELVYGENYNVDWLIADILHLDKSKLNDKLRVPYGWQMRVAKYTKQYNAGKPIQYILGNSMFFERRFNVDRNVLIPRQETELVVEEAIKHINKDSNVLDLCCGSGVIGITVALETKASVTMSDISEKALAVAKGNAKLNKAKCNFVLSDMLTSVTGKYDVIISNPPYITTEDVATLDPMVAKYEPVLALDGGEDGLNFYRTIASQADKYLSKNGTIVCEIGYNQGESVKQLFEENRYNAEIKNDYSGNNRILIATLGERNV